MKKVLTTMVMVIVAVVATITTPSTANAASSEARKDGTVKDCTIWVAQNVPAYGKKPITLPKGAKLKAVSERGAEVQVSYKGANYYVDSNYVLVNIKEYIPSLDINLDMAKKSNLFNMANQKITNVSNKRFYTSKGSKNGTAAWLKFSVAKKLLNAQKQFRKDGYSIVIYDAYRSYSVTCSIRDRFKKWLSKKSWSFKSQWFGSLGESWFLAQNASAHNYGRAVDMTLKSIQTGKELTMPSTMHTLDKRAAYYTWKSSSSEKAKNARYMKSKMESCGFTYLQSEWWHFQVNNIPFGQVLNFKI